MSRLVMFEYDPKWPRMFKEEASQLASIWGNQSIAIHHIGSTSVPGLRAKPIIDILVIIKNNSLIEKYDDEMIELGYRPRGECLDAIVPGTPGRFYYSKDINGIRTHQAHVMQNGHFDIKQKLDFRDYLRAHPDVAKEYAELKTRLIEQNTKGIFEYIEGKDKFVKDCIAKAAIWTSTGRINAPVI